MKKLVNGVEVDMPADEAAAMRAEWSAATKDTAKAAAENAATQVRVAALRDKLKLTSEEFELLAKAVRGSL